MYCYKRKAQYHETDQMGIVHHSNYIRWMEEARIEYLDAIGMSYQDIEAHGILSPVTNVSVSYQKSVQFADEVEISVEILRYTGIVLELQYRLFNKTKGEVCTLASSKHCFMKDGTLVSLKKALPDLDQYLAEAWKKEQAEH